MQTLSHGETIRLSIPADPKYVVMVRRAVRTVASRLGFTDDMAADIEVSVAEAVSNAIEHGSPEHSANAVAVVCRFEGDKLTIDVRDEGSGFMLAGFQSPRISLAERGRGLKLINRMVDRVRICRTVHGSKLRMVIRKPPHVQGFTG